MNWGGNQLTSTGEFDEDITMVKEVKNREKVKVKEKEKTEEVIEIREKTVKRDVDGDIEMLDLEEREEREEREEEEEEENIEDEDF